jgi:hypothetical protein
MVRQAQNYLAGAVSGTALIAAAVVAFVMLVSLQALRDWPLANIGGNSGVGVSDGRPAAGAAGTGAAAGTSHAGAGQAGRAAFGQGRNANRQVNGQKGNLGSRTSPHPSGGSPGGGPPGSSPGGGSTPSGTPSSGGGGSTGGGTGGGGQGGGGSGGSGSSTSGAVTGAVNDTVSGVDQATGGALSGAGVTEVTEGAVKGAAGPESTAGQTLDKTVETVGGPLPGGQ